MADPIPPTNEQLAFWERLDGWNMILREDSKGVFGRVGRLIELALGRDTAAVSEESGRKLCWEFLRALLNDCDYLSAAVFLWGYSSGKFDPRPECVRTVFSELSKYNRIAFQGASGVSKTYSILAWLYLDYIRDPENTGIRISTTNQRNLDNNIFSVLARFHISSVLQIPGIELQQLKIASKDAVGDEGILGMPFPQDQVATGRYRGFKVWTRAGKSHVQFGNRARIRVYLDEASDMPIGIWKDLGSVESQLDGVETVKLICSYNPIDVTQPVGKITEPRKGWTSIDPDEDFEWTSKQGWHVRRLDGMRCENVIHRRMIYNGLQTWEGFQSYLQKGDQSAEYWYFGRGMFPLSSSMYNITPLEIWEQSVGEAIFVGRPVHLGAADLALLVDRVILIKAKFGEAAGYINAKGERIMFVNNQTQKAKTRYILQFEQAFEIQTGGNMTGLELAHKITNLCKKLQIPADNFAVDKSGSGGDIHNQLLRVFGQGILGITWNTKASDNKKMMAGDKTFPADNYTTKRSEMYFCTDKWLRYGIIKISPTMQREDLFREGSNLRQATEKNQTGKIRVEDKAVYRARTGSSPDVSDSAVMLSQLVREKFDVLPGPSFDEGAMAGGDAFEEEGRSKYRQKPELMETVDTLDLHENTSQIPYSTQNGLPDGDEADYAAVGDAFD